MVVPAITKATEKFLKSVNAKPVNLTAPTPSGHLATIEGYQVSHFVIHEDNVLVNRWGITHRPTMRFVLLAAGPKLKDSERNAVEILKALLEMDQELWAFTDAESDEAKHASLEWKPVLHELFEAGRIDKEWLHRTATPKRDYYQEWADRDKKGE